MGITASRTEGDVREERDVRTVASLDSPWTTVVWNDPVNLMTYVAYVFRTHFGFSADKAERLMLAVHREGRAIVATGPREVMEGHVVALHGYGLHATVEKAPA